MTKLKDQMTSNERMAAYFDGKEVDRLPAMPMIDSVGPRLIGEKNRFKRLSAENQVLVQKKAYELLGLDGLSIEYGLHGIGQACGTKLGDNENSAPHIVEHVLKDLKDVDDLDPECVLRKGLSHLNKMWQPLNVNSRQLQTESKLSVISSLLL